MTHQIVLDSRAEEAERLLEWLDPLLLSSGLDELASFHFRCAIVEVVNNCVRHAYGFETGHPIEVDLDITKSQIQATVRDRGPAFDPPTEKLPSELMAESGRGYEIIRAWVDQLQFERTEGWNVCRLTRDLH